LNPKVDKINLELEKGIDLEVDNEIKRAYKIDKGLWAQLILLQRITRLLEKLVNKYWVTSGSKMPSSWPAIGLLAVLPI